MKNTARLLTVLFGALLVVAVVGCPKKVVKEEPIPPPPPPDTTPEIVEKPKVGELATIYFDFDKSDIRTGEVKKLTDNANAIKAAGNPMVTIEGYCCPIGTSEYNMALGQRRAEAAKAYLVKLGVPASQLTTISYGEERLATTDPNKYELNRRCEFKASK
ncbi:MAG: OmpA family protein [candidate division WOR-3 bacterium]